MTTEQKLYPEEKTKRIFIPMHLYRELSVFAKARNKTVDEVASDLLQIGMDTTFIHLRMRRTLNKKD